MKFSLNTDKQLAIVQALGALDGYMKETPGVEHGPRMVRVPFKLGGPARRAIVHNMAAVKPALASHEQVRKDLFAECFPHLDVNARALREDNVEAFDRFQQEIEKITKVEQEFELLQLPFAVLYSDENDIPTEALLILQENNLIGPDPDAPAPAPAAPKSKSKKP